MENSSQCSRGCEGGNGGPWRDVNAIFYSKEKSGGKSWRYVFQEDFTNFVLGNGLVDIHFKKGSSLGPTGYQGL